jgi:hypothetical protein
MVERSAVNRNVGSSNLPRGAISQIHVAATAGHRFGRLLQALYDFRQEPGPALGLIDPNLNQTGRRYVVIFLARFVSAAEIARQRLIIGAKFCQHLFRSDAFVVVIFQALVPGDVANRAQRGSTDFPRAFSNIIGDGKYLFSVLVEQQVIITEVLAGHVPVKILSLQVQRKRVGEQLA